MQRPKLIVFDLDYTLWPFWVDYHVSAPFKKESDGIVYDRNKRVIDFYGDVPDILESLIKDGYELGIASRTSFPDGAQILLNLFEWNKYFTYKEMYPGCKVTHFERIHQKSKIPYNQMMFFDDEARNIYDIEKLGVKCVLVDEGVSKKLIKQSLELFNDVRISF